MVVELCKVFGDGPYSFWAAVGVASLTLPEANVEIKDMTSIA